MNNIINIANTGNIKTSTAGTAPVVETNPQGIDGTKSYNSADKTSLFHDTIQKQYRESASNSSNENNKASGNNLPFAQDLSEVAETDGRSTSHGTATESPGFASNTQNTSDQPALVTAAKLVSAELDKENPIANDESHNPLLAPATQTSSGPATNSLSVAISAAAAPTDNSKLDVNNEQTMSSNTGTQDRTIAAVLNDTSLANSKIPVSELNNNSLTTTSLTSNISDNTSVKANEIITSSHDTIKDTIKNTAVKTNTAGTSAAAKTASTINPGNLNSMSALQTQDTDHTITGRDLTGKDSAGHSIAGNTLSASTVLESAIETTRPLVEKTTNDEPANKASPVNIMQPSNLLTAKADSSPKPVSGTEVKQLHIVTESQTQESVRSVQDNIIETVKFSTLKHNVDDKINVMPSQISQLIKAELNTNTHNATATVKPTATTTINSSLVNNSLNNGLVNNSLNNGLVSSGMENPSLQTTDTSSINTRFTESIADKNQLLTSIQSSLLLPTTANKGELIGDGLPVTINTATATLSSANATPISQLLSTPQTEISEPFGRTTWSQAMGKQVLMMINQNIGSAEIRLNPANLGPIEIHIDMSEDQVNVVMSSRHAIVREAMEQALPRLREMLDDNGFNLAGADVSQQSFAEQREQNANNHNIIQQSNEQMLPIAINESTLQQTAATDSSVDYYI